VWRSGSVIGNLSQYYGVVRPRVPGNVSGSGSEMKTDDARKLQHGENDDQKKKDEPFEDLATGLRAPDELVPRARFFFPVLAIQEHFASFDLLKTLCDTGPDSLGVTVFPPASRIPSPRPVLLLPELVSQESDQ
jgi:hypothetical protein